MPYKGYDPKQVERTRKYRNSGKVYRYTCQLARSSHGDVIAYLDGYTGSKNALFAKALREYMERHPEESTPLEGGADESDE